MWDYRWWPNCVDTICSPGHQSVRQLSEGTDRDRVSCMILCHSWIVNDTSPFPLLSPSLLPIYLPPSLPLSFTLPFHHAFMQRYLHQMDYLLEFAMTDDERGKWKDAENLCTSAIEFALEAVSTCIVDTYMYPLFYVCSLLPHLLPYSFALFPSLLILLPSLFSFSPPLFLFFHYNIQQKRMKNPTCKAKLLKLTTHAVERVELLKQKDTASALDLDKLDQLPPPSAKPRGGLSKSSARGGSNELEKVYG